MDENDININDINQKLDELIKKNKLLKEENEEFKKRFLKDESHIHNLNIQLDILRKEYKALIYGLVDKYDRQVENILQQLSHLNEKVKKNEIVMEKELNNNKDSKIDLFGFFKSKKEKNKREETPSQNKNSLSMFNDILLKIFYTPTKSLSENLWNDLKKFTKVLIIEGLDPIKEGQNLFDQNVNKYVVDMNECQKSLILEKKENIFNILKDVSLNKISEKNEVDFRMKFREKYGISYTEINDKDLDNLIKKHKKDEDKIIGTILERLNYIQPKKKKKK